MNLSLSSILAGLVFSTAGLFIIKTGKSRANFILIIIGITMMAYTYFTSNPWADWGIGLALAGGAYQFWDT